jgi:hypothetical protein
MDKKKIHAELNGSHAHLHNGKATHNDESYFEEVRSLRIAAASASDSDQILEITERLVRTDINRTESRTDEETVLGAMREIAFNKNTDTRALALIVKKCEEVEDWNRRVLRILEQIADRYDKSRERALIPVLENMKNELEQRGTNPQFGDSIGFMLRHV